MINLTDLEKNYEVYFDKDEGAKHLYLRKKSEKDSVLGILDSMYPAVSLSESIEIGKKEKVLVDFVGAETEAEKQEMKMACSEMNAEIQKAI